MFNWLRKLFNKHENNIILDKVRSPIDRVASKIDKDFLDKPKYWSIYGIIHYNNRIHAIIHWQGWEDAGWKLIPIDELEPFRMPDLSRVEFHYTYPNDIHKWYHDLPSSLCNIVKFYMNRNELWATIDINDSYNSRRINTSTEYLYDVEDPQFYGKEY